MKAKFRIENRAVSSTGVNILALVQHPNRRDPYAEGVAHVELSDPNIVFLSLIEVEHPDFRHQGMGSALMEEVVKLAEERQAKYILGRSRPSEGVSQEIVKKFYRKFKFQILPNGYIFRKLR